MYRRPDETKPRQLSATPLLESWNAKTDPAQVRLATYLDELAGLVALPAAAMHLALDLRVGLPPSRSLTTGGGDLDNYLFPIMRRLGAHRFDAVFGSKTHEPGSTITVAPARRADAPRAADMTVRTSVSASTSQWKAQVNAACANACLVVSREMGVGPLAIDLEFNVSNQRNWSTLWKPAIDSLGPLLGLTNPARHYMPNDDRIVALGLHRTINDRLGWDIELNLWWKPAAS